MSARSAHRGYDGKNRQKSFADLKCCHNLKGAGVRHDKESVF